MGNISKQSAQNNGGSIGKHELFQFCIHGRSMCQVTLEVEDWAECVSVCFDSKISDAETFGHTCYPQCHPQRTQDHVYILKWFDILFDIIYCLWISFTTWFMYRQKPSLWSGISWKTCLMWSWSTGESWLRLHYKHSSLWQACLVYRLDFPASHFNYNWKRIRIWEIVK